MENWVSVFTTTSELEAGIVKDLLDEAGIPAVILNQKDSSYQTFGDISVMVSRDDQEEAKKDIKDYYAREKIFKTSNQRLAVCRSTNRVYFHTPHLFLYPVLYHQHSWPDRIQPDGETHEHPREPILLHPLR